MKLIKNWAHIQWFSLKKIHFHFAYSARIIQSISRGSRRFTIPPKNLCIHQFRLFLINHLTQLHHSCRFVKKKSEKLLLLSQKTFFFLNDFFIYPLTLCFILLELFKMAWKFLQNHIFKVGLITIDQALQFQIRFAVRNGKKKVRTKKLVWAIGDLQRL